MIRWTGLAPWELEGGPASRHGGLNWLFQVALHLPSYKWQEALDYFCGQDMYIFDEFQTGLLDCHKYLVLITLVVRNGSNAEPNLSTSSTNSKQVCLTRTNIWRNHCKTLYYNKSMYVQYNSTDGLYLFYFNATWKMVKMSPSWLELFQDPCWYLYSHKSEIAPTPSPIWDTIYSVTELLSASPTWTGVPCSWKTAPPPRTVIGL